MLAPVSQLLQRHLALFGDRRVILINPPRDSLAMRLAEAGEGTIFDQRRSDHLYHQATADAHFRCEFGLLPKPDHGNYDAAVVFLAREKALSRLLLEIGAASLGDTGTLWLVGENRSGARSAGKLIADVCDDWEKVDAARHCCLFAGSPASTGEPPDLEIHARRWDAEVAGMRLELVSLPGVFSHGELDPATRMLLESLPELSGREVLDFGCGCGAIGLHLALRPQPASVTLSDDSALALESARLSFAANAGEPEALIASDRFAEIDGRFDAIVSNPPFHRGVKTDYQVAEALIDRAPDHLRPDGTLIIVANSFLDYGRRIRQRFGNCDALARDTRFSVYMGTLRGRHRPSTFRGPEKRMKK